MQLFDFKSFGSDQQAFIEMILSSQIPKYYSSDKVCKTNCQLCNINLHREPIPGIVSQVRCINVNSSGATYTLAPSSDSYSCGGNR